MNKLPRRVTIYLLQIYKLLSPIRHQIMLTVFGFSSTCKQKPSCYEYTISQIETYGTITGLKKGLWRILHCH